MSFPGYPPFLADACAELGLPDHLTHDAGRQKALTELANLASQALHDGDPHPDTVRRVRELRDALCVAALAATRMVQLFDPAPPSAVIVRPGDLREAAAALDDRDAKLAALSAELEAAHALLEAVTSAPAALPADTASGD